MQTFRPNLSVIVFSMLWVLVVTEYEGVVMDIFMNVLYYNVVAEIDIKGNTLLRD